MCFFQNSLVIGIRMYRSHKTALDSKRIIQHLADGCQTVCRARSVGNNIIFSRVINIFIHTYDDGRVFIFTRSSNNNLLNCSADMFPRAFSVFQFTCGFDNDFRAVSAPVQIFRIPILEYMDAFPVDNKIIFINFYLFIQTSMNRIIFQKISSCFRAAWIVDGDNIQIRSVKKPPKNKTSNSSKTVNCYFCHSCTLL